MRKSWVGSLRVQSRFFNPIAAFHFIPPSCCDEHFHPDPVWLTLSCSSSAPTDGQIIAFTMLILMKHKNASHIPPRFLSLTLHLAKPILDPLPWRITLRHFDLQTIEIKLIKFFLFGFNLVYSFYTNSLWTENNRQLTWTIAHFHNEFWRSSCHVIISFHSCAN